MAMDGAEMKVTAVIRGMIGAVIGTIASASVFYMMYEELLAMDGKYAQMWKVQAGAYIAV